MTRLIRRAVAAAAAIGTAAGLLITGAGDAAAAGPVTHRHACAAPTTHHAACLAQVDSDAAGRPLTRAAAAAAGLAPYQAADLQEAYRLPSATRGTGQTIAIVDAFDDPSAEADLAAYRTANGLPSCTTANGCFRKVDQRGGTNYPVADPGWALEVSLDLDMASAACPNCNLLLVEGDDNSFDSLAASVDKAVELGANTVSNSYGTIGEFSDELAYASHYDHPGTVITASSGDFGFADSVPAVYASVIAVGGTTLYRDGSTARGWGEIAWSGAGSGCSAYVAKPSWQRDKLCRKRTVADVSAVADPDSPVAVYDTFGYPGWVAVGGTSASSPLIAGAYALAGNADTITPGAYLYSHRSQLFDVTSGSNGYCGGSYLCTAVKGYDGPTGLGTPNGIGAL